jgi:hypothetical protein
MMNTQNHIPEEIQWQIFELLEGNLSEKESEQTLKIIESNANYRSFYRELSLTYLKPEKAEYPKKSALLKSSAGTFKVWRNLTLILSSAAAIALFIFTNYESPHVSNNALPSKSLLTASENIPSQTESKIKIASSTRVKPLANSKINGNIRHHQKDSQALPTTEASTLIAKVDVPKNKPFRVIPIIDDASQDFTSPRTEINSEYAKVNSEPEIQIVYTGFEDDETEPSEATQTEFLLDIAQNLRYGRLPKMQLVPKKRQNHLIPQVDMRLGTNTRFIQTTLIQ